METSSVATSKVRRFDFNARAAGAGTFLLLLIVGGALFAWSVVAGVICLAALIGGFVATNRSWFCGKCGNRLADSGVLVCPACHSEIA